MPLNFDKHLKQAIKAEKLFNYKAYAKELKHKKLINIDLRKKLTPSQKRQITIKTNRYETIVAKDYDYKFVSNKKTLATLKKSSELVIGNRVYFPKRSNLTFKRIGDKVKVVRNYTKKRSTTITYGGNKNTCLTFHGLLAGIEKKLPANTFYIVYVNGVQVHTALASGEYPTLLESLEALIDKGRCITLGKIKF